MVTKIANSETVVAPAPVSEGAEVAHVDLANAELATILEAWQTATDRLQETHQRLQHEVARLTNELEKKNNELARKNRLADLGQVAAHVAHEVRNELVPLTLYLSLLKRRQSEDVDSLSLITRIETGFTAVESTVNDMLNFTADRVPSCQSLSVTEIVSDICESLSPQLTAQSIQTEIDIPVDTTVDADPDMLRRGVLNLVLNALDVMPGGGDLTICGCLGKDGFELEIADTGPGLSDEVSKQLFEPFFTTKSTGSGLGLAIVNRIAAAHGGELSAANCPQGGAAFTLSLPGNTSSPGNSEAA